MESSSVLGIGAAVVDMVAAVDHYPQEDEKIRTTEYHVSVGGNAFNAMTTLSRLGIHLKLFTKVGDDDRGNLVISSAMKENINTELFVKKKIISAFTYVIVNQSTGSRTCIHTPSEDLLPEEVKESILEGISFLYTDSRHTSAALHVARIASQRKIPILIDCEKDRGKDFAPLLSLANYVVTNSKFPALYTKKEDLLHGLEFILETLAPHSNFIITTLGRHGAILMKRKEETSEVEMINSFSELKNKVELIMDHRVVKFQYRSTSVDYWIYFCSAYRVDKVVDTTGAGDCFIGTICYSILKNLSIEKMLMMATYMAGVKCKTLGSTQGVLYLKDIKENFDLK